MEVWIMAFITISIMLVMWAGINGYGFEELVGIFCFWPVIVIIKAFKGAYKIITD